MINVTKPFLPPFEAYQYYLKSIWERNWLTNNGPLVNELEMQLKEYLGLDHLLFTGDGTIALQLAIRALGLKGEIITTPFSYVATTSSIVWEHCQAVYADIDPYTFNIDPTSIEERITERTVAILATHVYGNPCNIKAIENIADRFQLKVIYDGAHAFGTKYCGKSVFAYGDISTCSFHATKLFHTTEGGMVATANPSLLKQMALQRNFGHSGPESFDEVGINGKNSELHAAMGLCNIEYVDSILSDRKRLFDIYKDKLSTLDVQWIKLEPNTDWNHAYLPIVFKTEAQLLESVKILNGHWIYPRRYFYPSLSSLPYVQPALLTPVADDISSRVLCLPLYHGLKEEEINLIARLLLRVQNNPA